MDALSVHQAAKEGHLPWLKKASKRDINRGDKDGWTAVHWCAWNGSAAPLQVVLDKGGDVHKVDYKGNTPLHIAAAYGNLSALELLMMNGSNLFSLDDYGRTAARVAAFYQKVDCCRFLDTLAIRWQVQNIEGVQKLQIKAMKELKKRSKKEDQRDSRPASLNYDHSTAPVGGISALQRQQQQRPISEKISAKEAMLQNFELRRSSEDSSQPNMERKNSGSSASGLSGIPGRQAGPLINNLSQLPLNIEPAAFDPRNSVLHPLHSTSEPQLLQSGGSELPELKMTAGHPTATKNESALATFLHSIDLVDCIQVLHREKLDLDALNLCTEDDLISIGLSLGHRKKLLNGIARRKALLAGAGQLTDTEF